MGGGAQPPPEDRDRPDVRLAARFVDSAFRSLDYDTVAQQPDTRRRFPRTRN
jgi:hypothetical protein